MPRIEDEIKLDFADVLSEFALAWRMARAKTALPFY
jgi:hypothetical protein